MLKRPKHNPDFRFRRQRALAKQLAHAHRMAMLAYQCQIEMQLAQVEMQTAMAQLKQAGCSTLDPLTLEPAPGQETQVLH